MGLFDDVSDRGDATLTFFFWDENGDVFFIFLINFFEVSRKL